jgi:O-antigen biosynthesis alpha-1,2-mannosyltransferase
VGRTRVEAPVKIAFVSTYAQKCGVATYCEELAMAMVKLPESPTVYVLAEKTEQTIPPRSDLMAERCWSREHLATATASIQAMVHRIKPDVVHIQHEFGLFPNDRKFVKFVEDLRETVPVVVTLHTVFQDPWVHNYFFDHLRADRIIVHSAEALRIGMGGICLIPHGTLEYDYVAPAPADGSLRFLTTGFFGPGKGIAEAVEAFLRVRYELKANATYTLAGMFDQEVLFEVQALLNRDGGGHVEIRNYFHSFEEIEKLYRESHVIVLWHVKGEDVYSVSGQAHLALAFRRPAIYKPIPLYADIGNHGWATQNLREGFLRAFLERGLPLTDRPTSEWPNPSPWSAIAKETYGIYL